MLTVCVPTFRRPESLNRTLTALLAAGGIFDELLIVVTEEERYSLNTVTNSLLKAFNHSGVTTPVMDGSSGLIHSKLLFATHARNEHLLIIDDDMIVPVKYFEMGKYLKLKSVGAVSGVQFTPINNVYQEWSDTRIHFDPNDDECNVVRVEGETLSLEKRWQIYLPAERRIFGSCEHLLSGALFIKRELLTPDIELQNGASAGEDLDLTYGLHLKGWSMVLDTGYIAWHMNCRVGGCWAEENDRDPQTMLDNYSKIVRKYGLGETVSRLKMPIYEGSTA